MAVTVIARSDARSSDWSETFEEGNAVIVRDGILAVMNGKHQHADTLAVFGPGSWLSAHTSKPTIGSAND